MQRVCAAPAVGAPSLGEMAHFPIQITMTQGEE